MDKIIQISSGKGPLECRFVAAKVLKVFLEEAKENMIEYEIIHREKGDENLTLKSVTLLLKGKKTENFLKNWLGSICWIGKSTFRKNHQRSNWFIGIFELKNLRKTEFKPKDIQFQTTRSQGSGGQNVNKVSTAVRATHLPTKISVFVQDTRSQLENKKISIKRLEEKVRELDFQKMEKQMQEIWKNKAEVQRGNPTRIFKGTDFKKNEPDFTFKKKRNSLKMTSKITKMNLTKNKYYFEALDFYPYNLPDCLEALNYALSYDSEDADALCLMGRIHSEVLKNYEKAKEFFEEAMMFDVSNVNTPQYYIACLIENEDFAEAEKLITYALKIKGIEKSTLWFYRAMISERRGSLKNALKFLKEAEKNAFTSCSLEMVTERKKFVKSKLTKKRKETK